LCKALYNFDAASAKGRAFSVGMATTSSLLKIPTALIISLKMMVPAYLYIFYGFRQSKYFFKK
jgi:hypothetical protein